MGRTLLLSCCFLLVIACNSQEKGAQTACHKKETAVREIGRLLDPVGKALDDYGTVSVSVPVLAHARNVSSNETFDFSVEKGPDDYLKAAREEVQGGLAVFSQRARSSAIGIQGRFNIQEWMLNQLKLDRFQQQEAEYRRRSALQDAGALMRLVLPIIDPSLALALPPPAPDSPDAGDEGDAAEDGDEPTEDNAAGGAGGAAVASTEIPDALRDEDDPEKLTPEAEKTKRLEALIAQFTGASQDVSGATERPAFPDFTHTPPELDPDLLPDPNKLADLLFKEQQFQTFLAMLDSMGVKDPVVPFRSAILTAAGDTMVEAIMSFLGRPEGYEGKFDGKALLMGVSMVSVAPGTKTERGYKADVSVKVQYAWHPARWKIIEERFLRDDIADDDARFLEDLVCAIVTRDEDAKSRLTQFVSAKQNRLGSRPLRNELNNLLPEDSRDQDRNHMLDLATTLTPENVCEDWRPFYRGVWERSKNKLNDQWQSALDLMQKARTRLYREVLRHVLRCSISEDDMFRLWRPAPGQPYAGLYTVVPTGSAGAALVPEVAMGSPLVSAVSPMTEAQTLDLASSIRQQQAFALKLALVVAGFGQEAQKQGLFQHIQRLEQDARTRTPLNTVSAYSNTGGVFGYQIGPNLIGTDHVPGGYRYGLDDLVPAIVKGSYEPGPEMVLQRQSFPVMLFVGVDKGDLELRVQKIDPWWKQKSEEKSSCWMLMEPRLEFTQTTRWIPIEPPKSQPWARAEKGIPESDRVRWAWNLSKARKLVEKECQDEEDGYSKTLLFGDAEDMWFRDYVINRADVLTSQALFATSFQPLPLELFVERPSRQPFVDDIQPSTVYLKDDKDSTTFDVVILGGGLDRMQNANASLLGLAKGCNGASIVAVSDGGEHATVTIKCKPKKLPKQAQVQLKITFDDRRGREGVIVTKPIEINVARKPKGGKTAKKDGSKDMLELRRWQFGSWPWFRYEKISFPKEIKERLAEIFLKVRDAEKDNDDNDNCDDTRDCLQLDLDVSATEHKHVTDDD